MLSVAPPGAGLDTITAIWALIERGGVTALLFLAVAALFTGQVSSRRQADQLLKMQADRLTENDARWKERWQEQKERADRLEQLLFQQSVLANRVGAIAERVASSAAPPLSSQELRPGGG